MGRDDQTFRIVLLVGMAIGVPIGMYYRVRSQATGEKLARRQEGLFYATCIGRFVPHMGK